MQETAEASGSPFSAAKARLVGTLQQLSGSDSALLSFDTVYFKFFLAVQARVCVCKPLVHLCLVRASAYTTSSVMPQHVLGVLLFLLGLRYVPLAIRAAAAL